MRYLLFIAFYTLIYSCQSDKDMVKAHFDYLNNPNNNLIKRFESQFYNYKINYYSPEAIAYMSNQNKSISIEELKQLAQDYNDMIYYNLEIRKKPSTKEDLNAQFLAFSFQNNIFLVQQDTIPCSMFHLENNGNLNGVYKYQIGFSVEEYEKKKDYQIYIKKFGRDSIIKFNYLQEDIQKIKEL